MFGVIRAVALWVLLAMLAGFVIFVEFVAEVGGKADPIPKPTSSPGAGAAPGAMTVDRIEAMLQPV